MLTCSYGLHLQRSRSNALLADRRCRTGCTGFGAGIRSAPTEDLDTLTKTDLYKKAAAANLPGRSHMTRDDLVKALTSTRG